MASEQHPQSLLSSQVFEFSEQLSAVADRLFEWVISASDASL
jgi:hypothetical protein